MTILLCLGDVYYDLLVKLSSKTRYCGSMQKFCFSPFFPPSLILSSVEDSCLKQLLFFLVAKWWFSTFLISHTFIIWNSMLIKDFSSFIHLVIHIYIHLFQYGLIDSYFSLWLQRITANIILDWLSRGQCFQVGSWILLTYSYILHCFSF